MPWAPAASPEETVRDQLEATYIFRIAENIEWPRSPTRKAMRVVVFSESSPGLIAELKGFAADYRMHGLPVEVLECSKAEQLPECEVVFVPYSRVNVVRDLLMRLEGRPVLVISEDYENRRLMMVNILSKDRKKLQFEINKANVMNQGLTPGSKLLLLGGTELDVAKLYKEGQQSMVDLENRLNKLNEETKQRQAKVESEMTRLTRQIADSRALLAKSAEEYEETQKKLKLREEAYARLKVTAEKELAAAAEQARQSRELAARIEKQSEAERAQIAGFEAERSRLKDETDAQLSASRAEVEKIRAGIRDSTETLRLQKEQIEAQTLDLTRKDRFLLLLGVSVAAGIVGIVLIVRVNRSLARQRLVVSEQNEKLREAQADLVAARESAESANRAKSAFLANMSHELRTPLNAILGYSQMMMRDRAPDAPDADTLRIINRSGEHLLGLINSVLDLAKIESHKYTLEPEDFDLGQFLLELTDILRRRAEDKGVTLAVDQSSSFPRHVRADRNKLRQVLINIVGNAIKFTSAGGVTLKLTTNGQLRTDGVGELVFTVTDTGPGIHPEDIERIFKPFEQAAHRPKAEGTGLGLALAREFVRLMGGDVRVTSEYGHGSVFTFTIAFSPVDETSLEKLRAPPLGDIIAIEGAAGLRVLIVEDHPENRVLLRKILTPFGFDLAEAENGEIGVRLAAEWKPHLVLMDRRMPVMDGVTATRRIRELPEGAKIRISAVTAEAFREDCASMMEAGCDAFVRKPYRIDEILTVVADLLPVKLVRAEAVPGKAPAPVGDEAEADATRAAFAKLPPDVAAAVRAACDAADTERVAELLAPHAEAAAAAAPFLGSFRTDRLAALLPSS